MEDISLSVRNPREELARCTPLRSILKFCRTSSLQTFPPTPNLSRAKVITSAQTVDSQAEVIWEYFTKVNVFKRL